MQILNKQNILLVSSANRIYWTDGEKNQIESSDIDGGNRQVLTSDPDALMMDIVVNGQFLFYTAWNRQYVQTSHFLPLKNPTFVIKFVCEIYLVFHPYA